MLQYNKRTGYRGGVFWWVIPLSDLIQAATWVITGVYLILLCLPLLKFAPASLLVVTEIRAITALFAAYTGLLHNYLKRVVVYSTGSKLGYKVLSFGISQYSFFSILTFKRITHYLRHFSSSLQVQSFTV
jgi:NADH:ubiquinone oxidoreductase subunit 5 (subunit L)/multisubunit Na+/H+ antiporter MnhA subunit